MITGTYTYKRFYGYNGALKVFRDHSMRVEIVEERYTRYRVKYLELDTTKGAANTLHWVQKKSVRLDVPAAVPPLADIRLPYKD